MFLCLIIFLHFISSVIFYVLLHLRNVVFCSVVTGLMMLILVATLPTILLSYVGCGSIVV